MNTTLVYSFGQTVLDSSSKPSKGKSKVKLEAKDPDEHQIIEDYEGECEKCESQKPQKACSICSE